MTIKSSELLLRAEAKILDPKNWMQGDLAERADGSECHPFSSEACKWCAVGALHRVGFELTGSSGSAVYFSALGRLGQAISSGKITEYNDSHTHGEVLTMFQRAITLAEEAGD